MRSGKLWTAPLILISILLAGLLFVSCGGDSDGGGGDDDTDDDTDDDVQDDEPPSFDGAAGAEAIDYHTIKVYWDAATDDNTDPDAIIYSVYAAKSDEEFDFSEPAATSTIGKTYVLVSPLEPNTSYKFVVRATDTAGNQEENDVEVSATTDEVPPPECGGLGGLMGKQGFLYAKVVDGDCNP
ncbi:MAG TPA: fibronectin type III domain-containing protein, partial [Proteobacteria bacterium]|nr:fibronectin type III domain-containing protein [Pseudomonadota bacterium]